MKTLFILTLTISIASISFGFKLTEQNLTKPGLVGAWIKITMQKPHVSKGKTRTFLSDKPPGIFYGTMMHAGLRKKAKTNQYEYTIQDDRYTVVKDTKKGNHPIAQAWYNDKGQCVLLKMRDFTASYSISRFDNQGRLIGIYKYNRKYVLVGREILSYGPTALSVKKYWTKPKPYITNSYTKNGRSTTMGTTGKTSTHNIRGMLLLHVNKIINRGIVKDSGSQIEMNADELQAWWKSSK